MTDRRVLVGWIGIPDADLGIAALAGRLAPRMGVPHADPKARESLACDLMEPVRPQVDGLVLDLLTAHTFAARDVFETRQGVCRLDGSARREGAGAGDVDRTGGGGRGPGALSAGAAAR